MDALNRPRRPVQRLLFSAAVLCLSLAPQPARAQGRPDGPGVPVTVDKVVRQNVPIWLRGLGTVQAYYVVQLRPRVDGTLTQVPVTEGQDVKTGDVLAIIDPRPYQAALDAVQAKKQQDQAQLGNVQADLARYAALAQQNFASRQQFETQAAMVKQVTATVAGDDAQIATAQLNLSFCYILAPFDGRVGLRSIDPGNVVHPAEAMPILSLSQVQPIAVMFTLPQDRLPAITRAMRANAPDAMRANAPDAKRAGALDVVVYASDDKTELDRGKLLTLDNSIDAATGTIKLKATFGNTNRTLWPGQFVNARLLLGTDDNVTAVAGAAVQHGPNGLYVYRLESNNTVALQPIEVSRQEGNIYVVSQGLTEGMSVVTGGQSRLQSGARVTVREAPPNPAKSGS